MRRALALSIVCWLLAGCGGSPNAASPAGNVMPARAAAHADDGATALPGGDGATALPGGDGATALPGGDGATALPGGDGATALPGAELACPLLQSPNQASCTVAINLSVPPQSSIQAGGIVPGLHPSDIAARYAIPNAAGGTVAIVDAYDDPAAESDLAVYRTMFGLPACTSANGCFRKVDQRGGASYPAVNNGWAEEIALDLDMVSAVCPNCSILLVEANSASIDDLGAGVDTAAALGANAISNSYYASEWSGELDEDVHYRHAGIPIVASAGDAPSAFYPATSPSVVSVGGTTLTKSGAAFAESAWAYGGRGCSAYEPRPQWQNGVTTCKTRAAVDVAAVADPNTGVAMFDSLAGGWLVAGGTSIGSPIVAAAYALAGNGAPVSAAYAHPAAFYALASGGFNAVTGLGSPDGIGGF